MIISQTPFRMSFFGGGTDYPVFYEKYGGSVLSTSFDKYCYLTVRHLPRFFNYTTQITYGKIERVSSINEIEHPAVREAMRMLDMHELIIGYDADLPARSGLGTSSSFAVDMLNAFYALKGKYASKRKLAEDAIYLERTLCKESGGIQDQIAAAYGGFNRIDFDKEGFHVNPIIISRERLEELNGNLMLFFTGFSRFSSTIAKEQEKNIKNKVKDLLEMKQLVNDAENILTSKTSLTEFGKLLDYTWRLKRGISSKVSTDAIDIIYEKALKAGAIGGKILGAGGGGFLLLYVEREKQDEVLKKLNDFLFVPFKFESQGTRILYYKSEDYNLKKHI